MLCPICRMNDTEGEPYCSSCEEAVVKLGTIMQTMGSSAEEVAKALQFTNEKEEVNE